MKTLLIDNYDSFTFNLFHLITAVNEEPPEVVRNDEVSWQTLAAREFDNIVISPGPGRPEAARDVGITVEAIRHSEVPVLGVCLGHQAIAHAFDWKVAHAPEPVHGRSSRIVHQGEDLFRGIPSPFSAIRYHSLIVPKWPQWPPFPLIAQAWTDDGLLMALRHRDRPIWGVQFHPESIGSEFGRELLVNFRKLTENRPRFRHKHAAPSSKTSAMKAHPPRPSATLQIPNVKRINAYPDAADVFSALFLSSPTAFWLDSSRVIDGLSRFSFLGSGNAREPELLRYSTFNRELTIELPGETRILKRGVLEHLAEESTKRVLAPATSDAPFDFFGGYVGVLGYEVGWECQGLSAPISRPCQSSSPSADSLWMWVDRFVAIDHAEKCCYLVELLPEGSGSPPAESSWMRSTREAIERGIGVAAPALDPMTWGSIEQGRPDKASALASPPPVRFRLRHSKQEYLAKISACMSAIRDGESYELCLTNSVETDVTADPFGLYLKLRELNPAPYAAFLKFPGLHILSSSPERFLSVDRFGKMEAKPIKGTTRRSPELAEDQRLKDNLASSPKDRSENLMITDLLRNDLGKVSEFGSVEVPRLMDIESYASVHQMVSTIRAKLRAGMTGVDAVRAAFPGGSMTGAPKRRTMELLAELEAAPRGIYSGALGYFSVNGSVDLSIVIRTIVATEQGLSIGAGGAIVALSDPAAEFDEMLLKARLPMSAIAEMITGDPASFSMDAETSG